MLPPALSISLPYHSSASLIFMLSDELGLGGWRNFTKITFGFALPCGGCQAASAGDFFFRSLADGPVTVCSWYLSKDEATDQSEGPLEAATFPSKALE